MSSAEDLTEIVGGCHSPGSDDRCGLIHNKSGSTSLPIRLNLQSSGIDETDCIVDDLKSRAINANRKSKHYKELANLFQAERDDILKVIFQCLKPTSTDQEFSLSKYFVTPLAQQVPSLPTRNLKSGDATGSNDDSIDSTEFSRGELESGPHRATLRPTSSKLPEEGSLAETNLTLKWLRSMIRPRSSATSSLCKKTRRMPRAITQGKSHLLNFARSEVFAIDFSSSCLLPTLLDYGASRCITTLTAANQLGFRIRRNHRALLVKCPNGGEFYTLGSFRTIVVVASYRKILSIRLYVANDDDMPEMPHSPGDGGLPKRYSLVLSSKVLSGSKMLISNSVLAASRLL